MFPRITKYALKNMSRNTFLSISSVLILTLLIFFINLLLVMYGVSTKIIEGVNEKLTISLYLDEKYDKNSVEVITLQNNIRKNLPEVRVVYKTKEEVLDELRQRDPELVNILEKQNPLPETITLENIPLKSYETLNTIIENQLSILSNTQGEDVKDDYFSNYTKQFERIEDIIGTLTMLQIGLYIIIITFIISIAIIVSSIIGNFIYYYRDEIYITRLVGGSKFFIYGPFALQGMMYVALACLVSFVLFFIFLGNMRYLFELSDIGSVFSWNLTLVLLWEFIVLVGVGGLSGFFSSRRYLQSKK